METLTSVVLEAGKAWLLLGIGAGTIFYLDNLKHLKQDAQGKVLLHQAKTLTHSYVGFQSLKNGLMLPFNPRIHSDQRYLIDVSKLNYSYLEEDDGSAVFTWKLTSPFGTSITFSQKRSDLTSLVNF